MKFDKYPIADNIKKRITELEYKKPTDIQFKCIPHILKGEDLLAIAQTGTGKTAAYAIPILHLIQHEAQKSRRYRGLSCLVMVPTRELAVQIKDVFNNIGKYTNVKTYAVIGGVDQDPQIARIENDIDILVATPGRMFDLIYQKVVNLTKLKFLVVDEADHMLGKGFIKDIEDAVGLMPRHRQTLFISATIDKEIKSLAYSLVKNAIRIQLSPKDPVSKNVSHYVIKCDMDEKRYLLENYVKEHPDDKVLVFVRTKVRAERVMAAMKRVDVEALTLHGDKDQADRLKTIAQFKEGSCKMLVATDVSARGIDIDGIDAVINYDLPDHPDQYVHRVGRTGRGRSKGNAYAFCAKEEEVLLAEIESYITKEVTEITLTKAERQSLQIFSFERGLTMDSLTQLVENIEAENSTRKRKKK